MEHVMQHNTRGETLFQGLVPGKTASKEVLFQDVVVQEIL